MKQKRLLRGKRIIFIFGNLELGGAERQGVLLAKYLREEWAADVEIWGLDTERGALAAECSRFQLPCRGVRFNWRTRYRPASLLSLMLQLRRSQPCVLMPYTAIPNLSAGLVWRMSGAKACIWSQEDEGLLLNQSLLHRYAVGNVSGYISNSCGGKDFIVSRYGIDPNRVAVIHNGVHLAEPKQDRDGWRKRLGISDRAPLGCMLANVHPYKDHRTLLEAWQQVGSCGSEPPLLLLAGRIDAGIDELKEQATRLGIVERVKFLGKVEDVAGLLQAVDFLVHSSRSEGLSNAVLEGMASGLVVVGSNIPGIRDAVGPEGSRFLAPVGDAAALAGRIAEVIENHQMRTLYGGKMQQRVNDHFSLQAMCEKSADVIASHVAAHIG